MKKKIAFTLIELLLALGIVGAIAALSAPSIMDNINRRVLTSQLKNITNDITFLQKDKLQIVGLNHIKNFQICLK